MFADPSGLAGISMHQEYTGEPYSTYGDMYGGLGRGSFDVNSPGGGGSGGAYGRGVGRGAYYDWDEHYRGNKGVYRLNGQEVSHRVAIASYGNVKRGPFVTFESYTNMVNYFTDFVSNTGGILETLKFTDKGNGIYSIKWNKPYTGDDIGGIVINTVFKYAKILEDNSNNIYVDRFQESENSTISRFRFGALRGYILEPAGESTTQSGRDKRIPAGTYNLTNHNSKKYPNSFKLYNNKVPIGRAILIHSGNKPQHTLGCLLPGSIYAADFVGNSKATTQSIYNQINIIGVNNVKVIINEIP